MSQHSISRLPIRSALAKPFPIFARFHGASIGTLSARFMLKYFLLGIVSRNGTKDKEKSTDL